MCQYNFSLKKVFFSISRVITDNESEFVFHNFRRHTCANYWGVYSLIKDVVYSAFEFWNSDC